MGVVHLPVMLREVIGILEPEKGGVYVDATVGLGGHSEEIIRRLGEGGMLIGLDRDDNAIHAARERISDRRFVLKKARFSEIDSVVLDAGAEKVDGVLFDLGVSMLQLKEPARGFSFLSDEPLDMRMDRNEETTAEDIVNTYSQRDIERILWEYGEERRSRKLARTIVDKRKKGRIRTCRELADLISATIGRRGRIHPATRTFQALRVEVNRELAEIQEGLRKALSILASQGRIAVISYHSLEDRQVKRFMRDASSAGLLKVLTKKPLRPARDEVTRNPSARSAKLRAAEAI